jgi:hypothetical protein
MEEGVEEAGGAEKGVEVLEVFEVHGHLQQELIGKLQERRLAADVFCCSE